MILEKTMKNLFEVQAELRTDLGKGASRRLRHAGNVPAIVYGSEKAPISITIEHNMFLRHLDEDAFYSHILTLNIDGKKQKVVLKDLQRHPASDVKIMHADFLRVSANHALTMNVPLHFNGEDVAPGVKAGGLVSHLMSEVEITCLPKDLPESIDIDVSGLDMDESIHLTELVLPAGVTLTALAHKQDEELEEGERSSYDQAVVSIHEPRVAADIDEDEEEDDSAEAVEAAETE
jgi:large subunit ribosomal protein L25